MDCIRDPLGVVLVGLALHLQTLIRRSLDHNSEHDYIVVTCGLDIPFTKIIIEPLLYCSTTSVARAKSHRHIVLVERFLRNFDKVLFPEIPNNSR